MGYTVSSDGNTRRKYSTISSRDAHLSEEVSCNIPHGVSTVILTRSCVPRSSVIRDKSLCRGALVEARAYNKSSLSAFPQMAFYEMGGEKKAIKINSNSRMFRRISSEYGTSVQ